MANTLRQGYLGWAEIDGTKIRCNGFNIKPTQDMLFYPHVFGLNDIEVGGGKGEELGKINKQKVFGRPSVKSYAFDLNHVADEDNAGVLFDLAKTANYFSSEFQYSCDTYKRTFPTCRINTFNLSITAGDVLQISSDVLSKTMTTAASSSVRITDLKKLITWDKVTITTDAFENLEIQSFTLDVNNNLAPIYTNEGLDPYDIRVGIQDVSGTITAYGDFMEEWLDTAGETPSTITLTAPNLTIDITCLFKPTTSSISPGVVVATLPYIGVDYALGEAE